MTTLRDAAVRDGLPGPAVSVHAFAELVGMRTPISVRDLIDGRVSIRLALIPNPDHLQINPELVVKGFGFTRGGRFQFTIHNWPTKVQDIHRQGQVSITGTFSQTESRDFARVAFDADVPNIEVIAVDDATGQSASNETSAGPFVVRGG
jgi:hypothetical protein